MRKHAVYVFFCLLLGGLVPGCGGGDDGSGPGGTADPVAQGWSSFESGDYASAASGFQKALSTDPTNAKAHNGLGWANLKLDNLQQALANFSDALTHGYGGGDPHAGRAVILRDTEPPDYNGAINAALAALAAESSYQFSHDAGLDWRDLRLILAQSYFALGQYTNANDAVSAAGGTAQDPQSSSFVDDLLAEIERLGAIIGG